MKRDWNTRTALILIGLILVAVNLIGLQPTDGPLLDRLNPGSWSHNSMHPNPLGHRLTAEALTAWLNDQDILAQPHPEPDPDATTELLGVRTARPYAVAPSTLGDLRAAPASGCDFGQITSFATRIASAPLAAALRLPWRRMTMSVDWRRCRAA